MSIKPDGKSGSGYDCGAPTCSTLPSCKLRRMLA